MHRREPVSELGAHQDRARQPGWVTSSRAHGRGQWDGETRDVCSMFVGVQAGYSPGVRAPTGLCGFRQASSGWTVMACYLYLPCDPWHPSIHLPCLQYHDGERGNCSALFPSQVYSKKERSRNKIETQKRTAPARLCVSSGPQSRRATSHPISFHIAQHSIPYMALSTSLLTWYQSALRSANSYTSSARNTPPNRSPSAIMVAISLECRGSMR